VRPLYAAAVAAAAWLVSAPLAAECIPAAFPADWLEQQEAAGGHTLLRHVGRNDRDLAERLQNNPHIRGASSFRDRDTAAAQLQRALELNRTRLNRWEAGAPVGASRVINFGAGSIVGRGIERGELRVHDRTRLRAVLRKNAEGSCFLLTAFPSR